MRTVLAFCVLSASLIAAGCGGSSTGVTAPTAPSSASGSGVANGATISGSVTAGSSSSVVSQTRAVSLTVEVVGTDLTTTVGPDGQFALRGIPPRTVELRFTGTGTNAKVTIRDVVANEQIVVRISVHGSTAVIESETRGNSDHTRAEVNGVIDSLTGTPAAFEFKVGSRVVHGDAQTAFFGDGNRSDSFDDLKNGARVEVKGQQRDGFVYAERIHVNGGNGDGDDGDDDGDDNDDANEFETDGAVSGLNGSCPTLAFSVNGASIFTDGSTTFKHGPCSQLGNGDRVEVRGTQQADGRVRASKVDRENK